MIDFIQEMKAQIEIQDLPALIGILVVAIITIIAFGIGAYFIAILILFILILQIYLPLDATSTTESY